ncbi:MAG TPA: ABC transporter permease subunit [Mycobacteriales bacterium]|nr:ABC transporter permease subunit [Mycobacteriales bacterium]
MSAPAAADDSGAAGAASGAARGFRPRRTLPLRVEVVRQARRRRTVFALGFLVLLPFILVAAFALGSTQNGTDSSGQPTLVDLATSGAANFTIFTLFASAGFLLVVVVALFCGDTVASEASWSSLRYLLAAPVPRGRLLTAKLAVGLGYSAAAVLLLPLVALGVGRAFYGWNPVHTPTGDSYGAWEGVGRLGLVVGYLLVTLLLVGALSFYLSTVTDAPLGAVGGGVGLVIVSNILDAITALGSLREVLPTHYQFAWTDALTSPVHYGAMARGAAASVAYSAVFLFLAWRHFAAKDILS